MNTTITISANEAGVLTIAEIRARFRWKRICMALLIMQDDMRVAREIAAEQPRRWKRW